MPYLERASGNIFYEATGDAGPWVSLVNGFSRTHKDFNATKRFLLKNGYRVLLFDNRGAGATQAHVPFSLADIGDDLVAIWDRCSIECSHLIGFSMGGMIAQNIVLANPERVAKLVLVSTAPSCHWSLLRNFTWPSDLNEISIQLANYLPSAYVKENMIIFNSIVKQIHQSTVDEKQRARTQLQRNAIELFDIQSQLVRIQHETLVIHGRQDCVIKPEAAQYLQDRIARAKLEMLDERGHLLLIECPGELRNLFTNFLSV